MNAMAVAGAMVLSQPFASLRRQPSRAKRLARACFGPRFAIHRRGATAGGAGSPEGRRQSMASRSCGISANPMGFAPRRRGRILCGAGTCRWWDG